MTPKLFQSRSALCIAAIALLPPASSVAACRTSNVAQANQEIKLVIPFAVPVNVPVAPFAPYFYSYQAAQQIGTLPSRGYTSAATQADNRLPALPAPRPSLLVTHCAACHGGPSPKADLSFESIDKLSIDNRLNAIRAVVSGRMPKGEKLSPDDVHALVKEFADFDHGDTEAQR